MNTSNTNHAAWCSDHRGDLCRSQTWVVASLRLRLYGCETDVPPVHFDIAMPAPAHALAFSLQDAGRLADAIRALTMLGDSPRPEPWIVRLDTLEDPT